MPPPMFMERIMLKKAWHSIKSDVHHNNEKCHTGNNIESENYRKGPGGRRLCGQCKDLNASQR